MLMFLLLLKTIFIELEERLEQVNWSSLFPRCMFVVCMYVGRMGQSITLITQFDIDRLKNIERQISKLLKLLII